MTFSYAQLFAFTEAVFRSLGCPEADATLATETLLSADLRGVDSHGVARLVGYVRLWEAGRINATPRKEAGVDQVKRGGQSDDVTSCHQGGWSGSDRQVQITSLGQAPGYASPP